VHIYEYPPEIRKAIYTTNAVESLNSVIRAATKRRKVFPSEDSARKVIYLAIARAAKKWTMLTQYLFENLLRDLISLLRCSTYLTYDCASRAELRRSRQFSNRHSELESGVESIYG
jgi:Transposase, Mutator family